MTLTQCELFPGSEWCARREAHKLWQLNYFLIPSKGRYCLMHLCNNPLCIRLAHLVLGTHLQNAAHRDIQDRFKHTFESRRKISETMKKIRAVKSWSNKGKGNKLKGQHWKLVENRRVWY